MTLCSSSRVEIWNIYNEHTCLYSHSRKIQRTLTLQLRMINNIVRLSNYQVSVDFYSWSFLQAIGAMSTYSSFEINSTHDINSHCNLELFFAKLSLNFSVCCLLSPTKYDKHFLLKLIFRCKFLLCNISHYKQTLNPNT